jgi:hypothetical protein
MREPPTSVGRLFCCLPQTEVAVVPGRPEYQLQQVTVRCPVTWPGPAEAAVRYR